MSGDCLEFICNNTLCTIKAENGFLSMKNLHNLKNLDKETAPVSEKNIDLMKLISTSFKYVNVKVGSDGTHLSGFFSNFHKHSIERYCCLVINYWKKEKKHQRKLETLSILTQCKTSCKELQKEIELEHEKTLSKHGNIRPQNLLVFVNPQSGKRAGVSIYSNIISPLFEAAGIKATTIYTKYHNHAKEYVQTNNIFHFDGIIVIGGDDTFTEVATAVLINEQIRQGISLDGVGFVYKRSPAYVKPSVKLGIIPAGAGNCLAWSSMGTADPETAAIHIVCGETHPFDIISLHDDSEKFVQFLIGSSLYGYYADVLALAERMRIFRLFRYDMAIFLKAFKHQAYPCEVSYLESCPSRPVDLKMDTSKCRSPCDICLKDFCGNSTSLNQTKSTKHLSTSNVDNKENCDNFFSTKPPIVNVINYDEKNNQVGQNLEDDLVENEEAMWKISRGHFIYVNSYSFPFVYEKCLEGFSPSAHLGDGTTDLVLLHAVNRRSSIQHLSAARSGGRSFDFPFVETHRVTGFRLRPISKKEVSLSSTEEFPSELRENDGESKSNVMKECTRNQSSGIWLGCGETFQSSSFTFWVHKGLVNLFSGGIEK